MADTELHTLGMTNAFGDLNLRSTSVDTEALISRDPRTIVLAYSASSGDDEQKAMQTFMALPGASRLSAVKNQRVLTLVDSSTIKLQVLR